MKNILLVISVLSIFTSCKNEEKILPKTLPQLNFKLKKEIIELPHCQSAVYDNNTKAIYTANMGKNSKGDGSISKIDIDGTVLNPTFIDSLDAPKGIAIYKDKLYISDINKLIEADINTGSIIKVYPNQTAYALNDVAVNNSGEVFVVDTNGSSIHKLNNEGHFNLWIRDSKLNNPNGIVIKDSLIYVTSWGMNKTGRVSVINRHTKSVDTLTHQLGNLYGITKYKEDFMLVSEWSEGKIYVIDYFGNSKKVLDIEKSVGKIQYFDKLKLLTAPIHMQNSLLFFEIN